ncbi:glycosyltransferase [Providencia rettgeri]|uniref:glycosyltransferase n=1 Tax=Providencia rettgeri TaxID=587 RepID=UPI00065DE7A1|nr:glycosyltransferase [Providencia rettgeri]
MTINILYFSHEFPPDIGGSGVVAYQNASALISLGCNVDLLTKNSSKLSCPDGVNLLPTKNYHIWFLNYIPYINKLDKYDYIFINDPHSIFFSGLFFSKKNLSKSICFLHGSEPELILNNQTWKKK